MHTIFSEAYSWAFYILSDEPVKRSQDDSIHTTNGMVHNEVLPYHSRRYIVGFGLLMEKKNFQKLNILFKSFSSDC